MDFSVTYRSTSSGPLSSSSVDIAIPLLRVRAAARPCRSAGGKGGKQHGHRQRGHADGGVADAVGEDQDAGVHEGAAGVDDVRHIAVPFIGSRAEQWLAELADDPGRVLKIEKYGADVVGTHRADAVGDHKPASVSLDRRAAVAELDHIPGLGGHLVRKRVLPNTQVLREDNRVRLVVGPG